MNINEAAIELGVGVTNLYNEIKRETELGQSFKRNEIGKWTITKSQVNKFKSRKLKHGRFNRLGGK